MKKKTRNSNIELLRIIAMLMIVFHHFIVHGVLSNAQTWPNLSGANIIPISDYKANMVAQIIAGGGKIGVDLFVIITSYFLVNSTLDYRKQKFKITRLAHPVWFYSIVMLIIAILFDLNIGIKSFLQSILPIIFVNYWFITDYIILYVLTPYLNKVINSISQKQHLILLIFLMFITSFCPTFLPSSMSGAANNLMLFFSLYITGTYIRKYPFEKEKKIGIILTIIGSILLTLSFVVLNLLSYLFNSKLLYANSAYFAHDYSFIIYIIAIGLFLWGKNWKLKPNKVINTIAATTLGVYLLHDNQFMRQIIWINFLDLPKLIDGPWFNIVIAAIIICPIYFIICALIEFCRQRVFMKIFYKK